MAYPRRGTKNTLTPFYPRRTAEGRGGPPQIMIVARRTPLQGHNPTCTRWAVHEGRGRTPFSSTKGHEVQPGMGASYRLPDGSHELGGLSHEGLPLRTRRLSSPRRATKTKPLQGHNLGCPRRRAENTFFIHEGSRRVTKNTFFGSTKSRGGRRWAAKKTFCGRRRRLWSQNTRVGRETARFCGRRRPAFVTF